MFVLAATKEYVTIPDDISMKVEEKVHSGAWGFGAYRGVCDPDSRGISRLSFPIRQICRSPFTRDVCLPGGLPNDVEPRGSSVQQEKEIHLFEARGPTAPNTKNLFEHKDDRLHIYTVKASRVMARFYFIYFSYFRGIPVPPRAKIYAGVVFARNFSITDMLCAYAVPSRERSGALRGSRRICSVASCKIRFQAYLKQAGSRSYCPMKADIA